MVIAQRIVLAVNVAWFGLAFRFFSLRPRAAIKLLVPASARDEVSYRALLLALPFLGGFNFAFAALSAIALVQSRTQLPIWPIFAASGLAHATQFACNLPPARAGGRAGGAPWDVLRGRMAMIFAIDALCTLLNSAVTIRMLMVR